MSIIDGLADIYKDLRRSFSIPGFSTINRAGKLIQAGLLENDKIINQIQANQQQIETLRKKARSYNRRVRSCLDTQRRSKNEIKKLRKELKDLRKNYRKDHRFWGTLFFIPSVIPLVGDAFKRGLCRLTSPDYRRILDRIDAENETITDAIIKQEDILSEVDDIQNQIAEKKEENASLANYINELYENYEDKIPTILYIQDNIDVFQEAHSEGIISDRFMETISDYLDKMRNGQELPENINEKEFLRVLKDYKSVINSFKRQGNQTMLNDPEFLRAMDESERIDSREEEPAETVDIAPEDVEVVYNKELDEEGNDKISKRKQFKDSVDSKVFIEYGINASAFEQLIQETYLGRDYNFTGKQVLILLGALSQRQPSDNTQEEFKNLLKQISTGDKDIFDSAEYLMKCGAYAFKDVADKVASGKEDDINQDLGRFFIIKGLLPRYNKILEEYQAENEANTPDQDNKLDRAG